MPSNLLLDNWRSIAKPLNGGICQTLSDLPTSVSKFGDLIQHVDCTYI